MAVSGLTLFDGRYKKCPADLKGFIRKKNPEIMDDVNKSWTDRSDLEYLKADGFRLKSHRLMLFLQKQAVQEPTKFLMPNHLSASISWRDSVKYLEIAS